MWNGYKIAIKGKRSRSFLTGIETYITKFCDEIAVFDHGRVVQQGSHEAFLVDTEGKYHALWNAQAQYYNE